MTRLTARRVFTGTALTLVAAILPGLATSAHAATGVLNVVGTSDVSDSNLVQAVIKPGFEAYYKQQTGNDITLNYTGKGTGVAIGLAEGGTFDAMIVHAAALENQFVHDGFSLEKYGRAAFWGDFVLLGPASDPAGVLGADSKENIVQAFQKIATAGANGTAEFVSRGGTPGTSVAEHSIWALTSGVDTCTVPTEDGGGTAPSTVGGTCPTVASGDPQTPPDWYQITGLSQGLNVQSANTCNFGSATNDCYVFTDRGTYNFLQSTNAVPNLQTVVNDNLQAPQAQRNLLVNSFHIYGINPAAFAGQPNIDLNTTAAKMLLQWVTSPAGQSAVENYLQSNGDEPFRPSAAPALTAGPLPAKVVADKPATVVGSLTNVVPGTPALNGVKVRIRATDKGTTTTVASAKTDKKGNFFIPFVPTSNTATYKLVTPSTIEKIENSTLKPKFGDLLQQSKLSLGSTKVKGAVTVSKAVASSARKLEVKGQVLPGVTRKSGQLQLWAAHPGKPLKEVGHHALSVGTKKYDNKFALGSGTWKFKVMYVNDGVILPATSTLQHVSLG